MAKKKKRRRRRTAKTAQLMKRAKVAGWTAVYAYAKENSTVGPKMQALPYVDAIGYDATMALASHYLAKHGPRFSRKALDALSTGLCGKVGYDFGAAGFKVTGLGGRGLGALAGALNPDDFETDEDIAEAMDEE